MIVPLLLLAASFAGLAISLVIPGYSDFLLLAAPSALAALLLLAAAYRRKVARARRAAQNWIVVDGSNVMHWKDGEPRIATVREVVGKLKALGFVPGVVFDANAGYKLSGRYLHDAALGRLLGLPADRVMVVPKGTPADPTVLEAARHFGARVVSNDRFRDWEQMHPEVRTPGQLIPGGYRDGTLWLDVDGTARQPGRGPDP